MASFKEIVSELFTKDNGIHAAIALAVTLIVILLFGQFFIVAAALVAVGFYVREVYQAGWDWTLKGSLHKHLEWVAPTVVSLIVGLVLLAVL